MAARSTMGTIISHVRLLIGDAGTAQYSDDTIQSVLDRSYRHDIWYGDLVPQGTIFPGGTIDYLDFYSAQQWWEGSAVIYDGAYSTATATGNDWTRGHWTFGSAPTRPLTITGAWYDVAGGAAELCEMWAGSVMTLVDYTDPNHTIKYSQLSQQLRARAQELRGGAVTSVGRMYRGDTN